MILISFYQQNLINSYTYFLWYRS